MNKNVSSIKDTILSFKEEIIKIKIQYIEKVDNKIDQEEVKLNEYVNNLNEYRKQIKDINDQIIEIQDREDIKDIQINRNKLEFEINKFFKNFEILEPYHDIDEAINIIKIKWDELENDFNRKEQENKEKIPMYEKISNYISMTDVIESDRKNIQKIYLRTLMFLVLHVHLKINLEEEMLKLYLNITLKALILNLLVSMLL